MGSNPAAPTKQTPTNSGFLHFSVTVARARKTNKVAPKSWIATKSPGKNPGLCSSVREPFAASSRASVSRAPQQSHVRKTVKRKTRSAPNRAGSNLEGHTRPMVPIECDMRSEVGLVAEPRDCRRQVRIFPPPTQMSNQQPVTTAGEKSVLTYRTPTMTTGDLHGGSDNETPCLCSRPSSQSHCARGKRR